MFPMYTKIVYKKCKMCMEKSRHQKNMFSKMLIMYLEMLNVYIKNVSEVYKKCTMCMKKVDIKNICLKKY